MYLQRGNRMKLCKDNIHDMGRIDFVRRIDKDTVLLKEYCSSCDYTMEGESYSPEGED
jgi:hypothetical protein